MECQGPHGFAHSYEICKLTSLISCYVMVQRRNYSAELVSITDIAEYGYNGGTGEENVWLLKKQDSLSTLQIVLN